MRSRYLLIITTILLATSMRCVGVQADTADPPQPSDPLAVETSETVEKTQTSPSSTTSPQGLGVVSGIIDVAVDSAYDERDPAVALCAYDQYLVVYEQGGNIYGQRLSNTGALVGGAFVIFDGTNAASNPGVACEWTYNRFVVVWEYLFAGSDPDIRAQAVQGYHQTSGSQLWGDEVRVSEVGGTDEQDPAIACNSDDYTCLVVFEYDNTGSGDIYGRRLSMTGSTFDVEGDRFSISTYTADEHNPDVAWGGAANDYLVAWQYYYTTEAPARYRIVDAYIYDTYTGGGQIEQGVTFLISKDLYQQDQTVPAVAYNRDTGRYLVVFQYDFAGDDSDYDIMGLRLTPPSGSEGGVFSVAATGYPEYSPAVAFSGGPENLPGMGADQFLVTYVYEGDTERVLYGQPVKGTNDASDQLDGAPAEIYNTFTGINSGLYNPDVSGSLNNGRYLAVWESMLGGFAGSDYDVRGRLLAPYVVYLPLIIR